MNKSLIVLTAVLGLCAGGYAQDAPPSDGGPRVLMYQTDTGGPNGPMAGGGMFFTAQTADNGKVITGAPYTATASTEITQVLGDGNRIVNKSTASIARDSLGRTRREQTLGMVGPWQVNGPKLVFIHDPTTQTNYVLDPNKQVASVMKGSGSLPPNLPLPAPPPPGGQPGANFSYMVQAGGQVAITARGPGGDQGEDVKTESLGAQTMEGVSVEGKRVTRTIPAGQIGNVAPIESVSEVWFSPTLQVVVMSKHSDPRFGDTTYQLTGIQLSEPDPSLFQVPAGYTVQNMPTPAATGVRIGPGEGGQVWVGSGASAGTATTPTK